MNLEKSVHVTRFGPRPIAAVLSLLLLVATLIVVSPERAHAVPPFPILDSGAGAAGQLNPNWELLSNSSNSGRYTSDGWTRLSDAGTNQRTNMINNVAFVSSLGIIAEFDYRMGGGLLNAGRTGDGMSMYLIDGSSGISQGGHGGGLSYANSTLFPGVTGGYLGVGLDVYGNWSNNTQNNSGGITNGLTPSVVGIRGSGSGADNQYEWAGGQVVPGLVTATTGDPASDADSEYRRVRVSIEPNGSSVLVEVAMTDPAAKSEPHGEFTVVTSTDVAALPGQTTLPDTLKLGFGAATGGATNFMDVRNIAIRTFTDPEISAELSDTTPGNPELPAGSFARGDQIRFEYVATNNGPSLIGNAPDGVAVVYADHTALPLTDVTWTCTASGGGVCETGGGSGPVISEDWTGPAGASVTVTVDATISSSASSGSYEATALLPTDFDTYTVDLTRATVQRDGAAQDSDLSNNTASAGFDVVVSPDLTTSTIEASPVELTADGTAESTITVRLFDVNGDPLGESGGTVALSTDLGTVSSPATDNGDGTYTGILTSTAVGTATVGFTVEGMEAEDTTEVTFTAGPADATESTLTVTTGTRVADGTDTHTATATIRDQYGNPVTGQDITFTLPTGVTLDTVTTGTLVSSDAGSVIVAVDGTATAALTLTSTGAGTYDIAASIDDGELSGSPANITFVAGAVDATASTWTITPDGPVTVGGDYTATITARDASDNPVEGATAELTLPTGVTLADGGDTTTVTDADGTATFTLTSTVADTFTITATVDGEPVGGSPTTAERDITFTAGPADATESTLTVTTGTRVADGTDTHTATATIRDQYGNPVTGQDITFTLPTGVNGNSTSSERVVTSDAEGVATVPLTSTTVGTYAVDAALDGDSLSGSPADVEFVAGEASAVDSTWTILEDFGSQAAGGAYTAQATIRDAGGFSLLAGVPVTFEFPPAVNGGALTGTAVTDADGVATFTLTSDVAWIDFPITATVGGSAIAAPIDIRFRAGAPDPTMSTIVASPASIDVSSDPAETATVTVQLKDAHGNDLRDNSAAVQISTSLGSISPTVSGSSDGTYTALLSGGIDDVGTATLSFTIDTVSAESTASVELFDGTELGPLSIRLSDSEIRRGDTLTITGFGFLPGEQVTGRINSETVALGTALADDDGTVTMTFAVPADFDTGSHTATLSGERSGDVSDTFTVVAAPGLIPGLPDTGGTVPVLLALIGIGLLGMGLTPLVVARRRARQ